MASTNVIVSSVVDLMYRDGISVELNWTGTPTGTFVLQGSNTVIPIGQQQDGTPSAVTWQTLPSSLFSTVTNPAGSAAGEMIQSIVPLSFRYFRVQYTNSSGTGTLDSWAAAKSWGG